MHNKCNVLESSRNHPLPHPQSVEKLSSTKPVPGAKKVEDRWSREWSPSSLAWLSRPFSIWPLMIPPASSTPNPFSANSQALLLGFVSSQTLFPQLTSFPSPFPNWRIPIPLSRHDSGVTTPRRLFLMASLAMATKPQSFLYPSMWSTSALAPYHPEESFYNIGLTASPLLKKGKKFHFLA